MMPAMASSGQGSVPLNAQLLVDSIPALIHTARPDGYLDYFNKPWLEYLGVTLDKVTGWNWTAVVHPEDVEGIVAKWRACLATGEVFEYETRVRSANGEYRWMFHRKVPLRDANGNIVKWYGSSLDIEERKQAEEKLRRSERDLHSIIETIQRWYGRLLRTALSTSSTRAGSIIRASLRISRGIGDGLQQFTLTT